MGRPTDWHALDLDKDPVPGDPFEVKALAKTLGDFADDVATALSSIRGLAGDTALLDWVGLSGDAFRQQYGDLPKDLDKLETSYRMASGALGDYWPQLEHAQGQADKALSDAQDAQQQLSTAKTQLSSANDWVGRASTTSQQYQQAPKANTPPPDPQKVQAAAKDAANAAQARSTAQSGVNSAQDKLNAAKQLAADAASLRDHAADTCSHAIGEASDAGIHNKSFWQKLADFFVHAWHEIVAICKVIVAVLGVIVMIIGGPLAWVVVAAAAVVLIDTVVKCAQGKASFLDVAFAALDCIPVFKGLTTIGGLAKMAKSAPELLKSGKALENTANGIRSGGDFIRQSGRGIKSLFTCGDPIDVATGEMIMSATDVTLPGVLPLVLERHHRSAYRGGKLFGPSWASTLDQRLWVDDQGIRFTTADGMVLYYPVPEADRDILPVEGPRWPLSWDGVAGGVMTVHQPEAGRTLRFEPLPAHGPAKLWLTAVTDRNGNRVTFSYDEDGDPAQITHAAGYRVGVEVVDRRIAAFRLLSDPDEPVLMRYGYDRAGNLTEISDSSGLPLKLTYEGRRVTSWEDRNGTWYRYEYDENGRCVRTPGIDRILEYTYAYDEESRTTTVTDSLGNTSTYEFNDAYQLVCHTDPLGNVTVRGWDRYDRLLSLTDPLGRTTRYTYDTDGNVATVRGPDGSLTAIEYNDLRLPVAVTRPDGLVTRHSYDAIGNCTSVTDPLGAVTSYAYDTRGSLTSVVDTLGTVQYTAVNDTAGRPLEVTDAGGATIRAVRDAFGRVVETTDAVGANTRVAWTTAGRIARRELPDGGAETWTYDAEGNPVEHRAVDGRVTSYEYASFDLCSARTDPDGTRYAFGYDTELRLVSVTNPQGGTWSYTYDAAGRLVSETDFNGRNLVYGYDAAGQLVERCNGAGQRIRLERDAQGNVVRQDADGVITTFHHDALGQLIRATGPDVDLGLSLDPVGRVLAETVNGRTVASEYDVIGRRVRRSTPSGSVTVWEYDHTGRPALLRAGEHEIRFGYDQVGREVTRNVAGSLTFEWERDPRDRSVTQSLRIPGPETRVARSRTFTHSADGHLTAIQDADRGRYDFHLDAARRVTSVNGSDWQESYAYDTIGNLTRATVGGGTEGAAESAERAFEGTLLKTAGRTRYTYDAQGRVVARTRKLLSGGERVWRYSWNAEDRLTDVTTPQGEHWHYTYDPLGRRVAKELLAEDGATCLERVDFSWDDGVLAEQRTTRDGTSWDVTWEWERGDAPIAQTVRRPLRDASQEEIDERFYAIVTDLLGTPTEMVDLYGVVVWDNRPTLWGAPHSADGGDGRDGDSPSCPLRFPGQYHDAETGLHYNVHRYYEPETARYLSPDPLGLTAAPNHHAYVSNPLNWSDALGLVGSCTVDLYHGTTDIGAAAIRNGGVDVNFSTRAMDFGKGGFYVTNDLSQAQKWSRTIAGRSGAQAEVLHFRVPKSELDNLVSKKFHGGTDVDELSDFIWHNRTGGAMHNYDLVEGPMLMNLKEFRQWKPGVFKGHQIAVFTPRAGELLTNSLV